MKFKVGDKVKKVRKSDHSNCVPIGAVGVIVGVLEEWNEDDYDIDYKEGCHHSPRHNRRLATGQDSWLKLVSRAKPPKFILQYELDEDPVEEFQTLKEVKKRIQELSKRDDLKRHSIRVYEIKKMWTPTLEETVKIKGL